jgi:hypothetical protein
MATIKKRQDPGTDGNQDVQSPPLSAEKRKGSLVGAEGRPVSEYPGWDPENGVLAMHGPSLRPSRLVDEAARRRSSQ